jgi:small conductance mechanosensitive channel
MMDKVQYYIDKIYDMAVEYGPKVLLAIVTLIVGLWIIKVILKGINRAFEKSNMDESLRPFISSLFGWTLKLLLFISIASMVGIATTSFIAVIGAAGLAVGLALQGTLANFAGGAMILIFKPYRIGELIEAQGHLGVVKEIQIFVTTLLSPENKTIIIPNGPMSNGDIVNYSREGKIRVDMTIGVSYDSDIKKAKEVLMALMESDERVLADPAPLVAVSELADSSVNLAVRPWCNPADYWDIRFDTLENGKMALDNAGVTIPFPQTDVHLIDHSKA